jgi:L-ribulose-5-phosphate 3-epimerase
MAGEGETKMPSHLSRRHFLQATAATFVAARFAGSAEPPAVPKLKKAVKFGMIKSEGSIKDKLELIKRLGFQGVEFDSPSNIDRAEANAAQDATGIKIHGVIDSIHWKERLSDPDPAVRARGLEGLKTAIADAKTFKASSILLVPGKVADKDKENFEQVWERSQAEIKKVLPLVEDSGARLAIEVVWNEFLTKPDQLVKYVDEFENPVVGAYFDVSNMIKYGVPPADWIRALGPRLVKIDFKGYSKEKGWVPIGEGDEDWPEVLKALGEVGYEGWATSEVAGGEEKELAEISERMDRVLALSS